MNNLCADIGYKSVNHYGEQLCGDHVDIATDESSSVIVLADGLGSGVKASILSTLTSKIISTMMAAGLSVEDCVSAIASALPICSERGIAYSTFTIIHLIDNEQAELIQYDNPHIIMLRNGKCVSYPETVISIGEKKVYKSIIDLEENDIFVAMSDGCPHAGIGEKYNFGWKREEIAEFMESVSVNDFTAKTLATILVDECYRLYGEKPGDDATACVVRIRPRRQINLIFGPPENPDDADRMMSLFFSKEGKHIVCGGTTSNIAARFLGKSLRPSLNFESDDIPPTAEIEGVDLVTEGVITVNRVMEYAKDYLSDNESYKVWGYKKDGASLICRLLFEEATDINFFIGRAINPAHQNPELPINFSIKMQIAEELAHCLEKMGKRIKVSRF